MGYWTTTQQGTSLQKPGSTGLTWGDQPADMIDEGMNRLIGRLYLQRKRLPTVKELDALKYAVDKPAELIFAIKEAARVFTEDVERAPSSEEILAGLNFADSQVALETFERIHLKRSPLKGLVYGIALSIPIWVLIGLAIWWITRK